MGKTYYSDYVGHMMRQYGRLYGSDELSQTDMPTEQNVIVCGAILDRLPDGERDIVKEVYTGKVIGEKINEIAECRGIRPQNIWAIVKNFERDIAKERGLL